MVSRYVIGRSLRNRLPALYSQANSKDPVMYAKLFSPGSNWQCYVAEGAEINGDFQIYGLFVGARRWWAQINLMDLQRMFTERAASLKVDPSFKPTPLSRLVN